MSIENGVHQNDLQDYHQITLQNTDTSLDPQHNPGTLEQHSVLDKNSCGFEGSVDSATEGEKLPSAVQKRNTFKNRSVSNSEVHSVNLYHLALHLYFSCRAHHFQEES